MEQNLGEGDGKCGWSRVRMEHASLKVPNWSGGVPGAIRSHSVFEI